MCFGASSAGWGARAPYANGFFYLPTVLTNVDRDMRVMPEETFGPVASIAFFDTLEEGVRMTNDSPYGN